MNLPTLERAGALMAAIFLSRVWARWRTARRERQAMATPLVDAALVEAVFAPRPKDGDDPNLLAEMRDTLLHLNWQAYAEEFYGLHAQLASLYAALGEAQQSTMRHAALRLVSASDPWLQLVGAKTAAALHLTEAINPLRALLEASDADTPALSTRSRQEIEGALATLTDAAPSTLPST